MGNSPASHNQSNANVDQQNPFSVIKDEFKSLDQVKNALRDEGLESSNLIIGIDFTKSNEWTGKASFNGKNLHALDTDSGNPYEKAISIIGRTLSSLDEDELIPCFGFGDASTHDQFVFSFHSDRPCMGLKEVLACYRDIVPHVHLAGPTSFAPIIRAAITIVEQSGEQYHVLLIIADGQITRNSDLEDGEPSPQEAETISAIVEASNHALSIVLVGVGDGPWDMMKCFDNNIQHRAFDNFQFVNFTEIMSKQMPYNEKEALFALSALMEIPMQFKAVRRLNYLNRQRTDMQNTAIPFLPPPMMQKNSGYKSESSSDNQDCPVCWTGPKDMVFGCGHRTCQECGNQLSACPICREDITTRIRMYQ